MVSNAPLMCRYRSPSRSWTPIDLSGSPFPPPITTRAFLPPTCLSERPHGLRVSWSTRWASRDRVADGTKREEGQEVRETKGVDAV